jgi:hypothetical protein
MEGYKELLNQLNGLVNSLEKGELSLEELNELELVTRTLHERSIILRYKAFETSVLGEESDPNEDDNRPPSETEAEEEVTAEPTETVEVEAEETDESEDEPAFDFAIFDEESTEEEAEPVAETEPVAPEPFTPEPPAEALEAEGSEEPAEEIAVEPEPVEEVQPEPVSEPELVPTPTTASGSAFLDRFAQQDNSLAGRFSAGPLESLIGAFGLNERLRFINDLFDGSSEKFSDAIKALDTQSSLDNARTKVAGYAEENEWDPEEEVVAEFMNYLNRRYA